jgi:hypothetical protein
VNSCIGFFDDQSERSGTDASALSAWMNQVVFKQHTLDLRLDYDEPNSLAFYFDVSRVLN